MPFCATNGSCVLKQVKKILTLHIKKVLRKIL